MTFHQFKIFTSLFLIAFSFLSLKAFNKEGLNVEKLNQIHKSLKLKHGRFDYEYPEQLITATYLESNAKVLELGSNLGNNSLVISSILQDSGNLVTMETRKESIPLLIQNRDLNRMRFHIVHGALSRVPLIQKGCPCPCCGFLTLSENTHETLKFALYAIGKMTMFNLTIQTLRGRK